MILFFSVIGILQCYVLPGLIFVTKINGNLLFKISTTLIISILFNFFLVSFLISLNIYFKEVLYILVTLELLVILHIYKNGNLIFNIDINFYYLISLFVLLLIFYSLYKNTGNVFYAWDAVVSYNEWAIKFSNSEYPRGMVRPYLLPKLWSLIYLISDNNYVTLFSKFTTFFFPTLILLMCLDEVLVYKKVRDLYKLFLFCIFFYFKKNFILTGYVDIPLVAIINSFFYFIRRSHLNLTIISIFIGFTIKFSSIFIMIYFLITSKKNFVKKIFLTLSVIIYFIFLYHLKLSNFFTGDIFNEMGQIDNFNLSTKMLYAVNILINKKLIYFVYLPILFGFFLKNYYRLILIFYILPGFLYWALLLSYDDRNFLFLIPGLIIVNSVILEKITLKLFSRDFVYKIINKVDLFKKIKLQLSFKKLFFSIIFLIFGTFLIEDKSIIKFDEKRKNELIGNKIMNNKLVELIESEKINSNNFITDFQLIFYTPMFKNHFNWNNFISSNSKNLEKFDYYLIYGHSEKIRNLINKKINNRQSKKILDINGFILVGPN